MVLGHYLCNFLLYPWLINYDRAFWCHKSSHIHCRFNLVEDLLSFPWNYGVAYRHILRASNYASEWRTGFIIIFRFDVATTSSRWRPWTAGGVRLSWNWSPSSLVILHFFELSHLSDFVVSRSHFWWWTWNRVWRLLRDWRHLHFHMVFNSRSWTLSSVARSDSTMAS
jgi:hypothetical protein